ncbi:MAG: hypothetical protein O7C59_04080 [Rickettsia endosymbiont of Ixodes persulcatus]|nr:hypothetical protein [Rickettsia endosymbiont of Ixodes persulcatus]
MMVELVCVFICMVVDDFWIGEALVVMLLDCVKLYVDANVIDLIFNVEFIVVVYNVFVWHFYNVWCT